MNNEELKIGSTIWVYDINNCHYDENHHMIRRLCWRPMKIVGGTSRSWVVDRYNNKYPKKGGSYLTYEEQLDKWEWVQNNRHKIADMLGFCRDYETIKKVAEILGYKE